MKLTDTSLEGRVVIRIDGDLDHATVGALSDLFAAHLSNGNYCILLDLAACSYVDSAGLSALMIHVRTIQGKGTLAVAAPTLNMRRLLDIVGLLDTPAFEVYDDLTTACGAVPQSG